MSGGHQKDEIVADVAKVSAAALEKKAPAPSTKCWLHWHRFAGNWRTPVGP